MKNILHTLLLLFWPILGESIHLHICINLSTYIYLFLNVIYLYINVIYVCVFYRYIL